MHQQMPSLTMLDVLYQVPRHFDYMAPFQTIHNKTEKAFLSSKCVANYVAIVAFIMAGYFQWEKLSEVGYYGYKELAKSVVMSKTTSAVLVLVSFLQ